MFLRMRHIKTGAHRGFFRVLATADSSQAAMMVLKPGQATSDEPENEHTNAEQWLFVISGTGKARVGRRTVPLAANSLLLVEKGERHRIENTGRRPMVTLNFYAPPAYSQGGEVLLSAKGLAKAVADVVRGE
jgi:mannose-6-phosphate isomerase-like protein (cupin superfamily)